MKPSPIHRGRALALMTCAFVFAGAGSFVLAAPVITDVQGTVAEGSPITLMGAGFGAYGPRVVLFDDFERDGDGTDVRWGAGSATVGGWDGTTSSGQWSCDPDGDGTNQGAQHLFAGQGIRYSTLAALSGTRSARADLVGAGSGQIARRHACLGNVREVFVSYWLYMPASNPLPSYLKSSWLLGRYGGANCAPSQHDNLWCREYFESSSEQIGGNNMYAGSPRYGQLDWTFKSERGTWRRIWFWARNRTQTEDAAGNRGRLSGWDMILGDASYPPRSRDSRGNYTGPLVNDSSACPSHGYFQSWNFPGDSYSETSTVAQYDDIYIAVGTGAEGAAVNNGAQARVEIGDQATYTSCTKLAVTTATSWSDTQVTTTARLGRFQPGETAYLFVINADGEVGSGRQVTIGGAPDAPNAAPPPPSNARRE